MRWRSRALDLRRPQLVGILNLTPDSFSDGGELPDVAAVVARAAQMVADGADVLDLGGESSRPGAQPVSEAEELARVLPALRQVVDAVGVPVSIDTRRPNVARQALVAGAAAVNDTSGAVQPAMAAAVREFAAGWILMHAPAALGQMGWSQATAAMPENTALGVQRVADDLAAMVAAAERLGVDRARLAIDPGLGFAKTAAQNRALLLCPPVIANIGLPVYVGPSRKSFLVSNLRGPALPPKERLHLTAAAVAAAVLNGAAFVRVHDVGPMRQVVDLAAALAAQPEP